MANAAVRKAPKRRISVLQRSSLQGETFAHDSAKDDATRPPSRTSHPTPAPRHGSSHVGPAHPLQISSRTSFQRTGSRSAHGPEEKSKPSLRSNTMRLVPDKLWRTTHATINIAYVDLRGELRLLELKMVSTLAKRWFDAFQAILASAPAAPDDSSRLIWALNCLKEASTHPTPPHPNPTPTPTHPISIPYPVSPPPLTPTQPHVHPTPAPPPARPHLHPTQASTDHPCLLSRGDLRSLLGRANMKPDEGVIREALRIAEDTPLPSWVARGDGQLNAWQVGSSVSRC